MTSKIGNIPVIECTDPGTCELCGKTEELRPYGPNGENICFDCGMLDKAGTERRMGSFMFGDKN